MNLAYKHLLPEDFHNSSRVWIYQSNRAFSIAEAMALEPVLTDFASTWKSHNIPVKGYANLFFGQFIVLMADETATGVSGCSTDGSVRMIKSIEEKFNVSLFDRQLMAFIVKDKLQVLPLNQLQYATDNGFVDAETLYFNNLVSTKEELNNNWIIPVKESWLAKRINFKAAV